MHVEGYRERWGYVTLEIKLDDEESGVDGDGPLIRVHVESDKQALGGVTVKLLKSVKDEVER